MKGVKEMDHPHEVDFGNVPTLLEEGTGEAVWSERHINWHVVDGITHPLLGKRRIELTQIMRLKVELIPMKIHVALAHFFHDAGKVIMNYFLLGLMVGNPTLLMLYPMDVVFSSSCVDPAMEEICVGISFAKVGNSRTLLLMSCLKHGQTYDPSL